MEYTITSHLLKESKLLQRSVSDIFSYICNYINEYINNYGILQCILLDQKYLVSRLKRFVSKFLLKWTWSHHCLKLRFSRKCTTKHDVFTCASSYPGYVTYCNIAEGDVKRYKTIFLAYLPNNIEMLYQYAQFSYSAHKFIETYNSKNWCCYVSVSSSNTN